jgi:hypothetical protein
MTKSRGVGKGFGGGRPLEYKAEFNTLATNYCLLGAKDTQLAHFFGVSTEAVSVWKRQYPKFLQAIKSGREGADAAVAKALYRKALNGDTAACIFWLKNRHPEEWRDTRDLRHSGMVTLAALISGEEEESEPKPIQQIEASRDEE